MSNNVDENSLTQVNFLGIFWLNKTRDVKKMLNHFLLILFFILSFFIMQKYTVKKEADKYKRENRLKFLSNEKSFKKVLIKFNFFKSKDEFLSKQGYPLKLNIFTYYLLKISLASIFMLAASINYSSIFITIIFAFTGYFLIDLYILLNKRSRDNEICTDLLNVVNSISLQLSAHITLKDSLKKQFEICKNKDFKKAMLALSTKYELSELSVENAIQELKSKFDILEINMFCNSLQEYNKVENIKEVLDNLSEILKKKYIDRLKESTRTKILYITCGVILALGNIILIIFYPLFISIGQGFNTIFN